MSKTKIWLIAIAVMLGLGTLAPRKCVAQGNGLQPFDFYWMQPYNYDPWYERTYLYERGQDLRATEGVLRAPFQGTENVSPGIIAPQAALPQQNIQVPYGQPIPKGNVTGIVGGAAPAGGTMRFTMPRVGDVPRGAVREREYAVDNSYRGRGRYTYAAPVYNPPMPVAGAGAPARSYLGGYQAWENYQALIENYRRDFPRYAGLIDGSSLGIDTLFGNQPLTPEAASELSNPSLPSVVRYGGTVETPENGSQTQGPSEPAPQEQTDQSGVDTAVLPGLPQPFPGTGPQPGGAGYPAGAPRHGTSQYSGAYYW